MNKKDALKLAVVMCCVMLGLLYFVEWITKATKPAASRYISSQITNTAAALGTNSMTPAVRAGIESALHHVRDEMAHAATTNDFEMLKGIEATLTNVLARP